MKNITYKGPVGSDESGPCRVEFEESINTVEDFVKAVPSNEWGRILLYESDKLIGYISYIHGVFEDYEKFKDYEAKELTFACGGWTRMDYSLKVRKRSE